eukprot:TRINITY_DN11515_c0_g1_i2.p1 TRINITY_DN11515_c0_g1~~TRINITY_DN11515_c0_g1_i2.p1  ORF type:complete len:1049 (+),score=253.63 TRINITY_DN11515_c0_g1_i2:74-3220(+)
MRGWVVASLVCIGACVNPVHEDLLDGAKCNVDAIDEANSQQLFRIFNELMDTTYFRLFRVDLKRKCFRDVDVVPTCGEEERPDALKGFEPEEPKCNLKAGDSSFIDPFESLVDKRLSVVEEETVKEEDSCDPNLPEFWLDMCSNIPTETQDFVNLMLNPESYTGYNGSEVWSRVYHENCLTNGSTVDTLCYEHRVLYRLLSGMHSSINIHINHAFYPPSKSKGIHTWQPNIERFKQQFSGNDQYIKNLRFSFVVVLRALVKSANVMRRVNLTGIDDEETLRTTVLLSRLLDSKIMTSCSPVFNAFDESLLFKEEDGSSTQHQLKKQFKEVFKNVSAELDCITCQKCKLHGKLAVMGVGTALKILLIPEETLERSFLSREEIVALINTAGKMSSALMILRQFEEDMQEDETSDKPRTPPADPKVGVIDFELLDRTIGKLAAFVPHGAAHDDILDKVLGRDPGILALGKHYTGEEFARHALRFIKGSVSEPGDADAIIVGGGLAGLTAALVLLDSGATVIIVDKEAFLGGNSAKASSGINGVAEADGLTHDGDTMAAFKEDVVKSAGFASSTPLIDAFISGAGEAVLFLRDRVGMDLNKVVQMGGHSKPRTYRPAHGMAGAEITMALNALIEKFVKTGQCKIMKKTKAVELVPDDNRGVKGVVVEDLKTQQRTALKTQHVLLATGGFALGGKGSLLEHYRPDLVSFSTTNGKWCTGDGHMMASAPPFNGNLIDMEDVQVHPTGFIDPKHPDATTKTLSAELLRGFGGLLLLQNGSRFVNELDTRAAVTAAMIENSPKNLSFTLLVHEGAAVHADKHIPVYEQKGLMSKYNDVPSLAEHLALPPPTLISTIEQYNADAERGQDAFGKTHFNNVPVDTEGYFYAGQVTPVLHYTMGGVQVDGNSRVVGKNGVVEGLYAAGELAGGLHGKNRLGGNALTECVVFGRVAANHIVSKLKEKGVKQTTEASPAPEAEADPSQRIISKEELAQHASPDSLWVALHGMVYDLTDFAEEHPAGPEAITKVAGMDGTKTFADAHSEATLAVFTPIGKFGN